MPIRLTRYALPALLALAVPAVAVLAQTEGQPPPRRGPSPETMTRLQDGRIAMIKEALKLNETQLKHWGPVEEHMRASFAERQKLRAERRERREQGTAERPSLPDRLDRASQRMAQRAERMKAYAEALRPLYATLTEDQKAVAAVVLRPRPNFRRFHGPRWTMHRPARPEQK